MQYSRNYDFTSGQVIVADQVDLELNTIASVVNGNIDTDNIANSAITVEKIATPANPVNRFAETGADFVYSGLELSPSSGWGASQLTATITAGIMYIGGKRVETSSVTNHPFTASKDTYVDIDGNGTITYQEQTLGGAVPALAAGSMRLMMVKTDANKITTYLTGRIVAGASDGNGTIVARPINPTIIANGVLCHLESAGGTINDNSATTLSYSTTVRKLDTLGMFDGTSTITIPTQKNGYYKVSSGAFIYDAQTSVYNFRLYIYVNGNLVIQDCTGTHSITSIGHWGLTNYISEIMYLKAGDTIQAKVYVDTIDNGSVALGGYDSEKTFLEINMIGQ